LINVKSKSLSKITRVTLKLGRRSAFQLTAAKVDGGPVEARPAALAARRRVDGTAAESTAVAVAALAAGRDATGAK